MRHLHQALELNTFHSVTYIVADKDHCLSGEERDEAAPSPWLTLTRQRVVRRPRNARQPRGKGHFTRGKKANRLRVHVSAVLGIVAVEALSPPPNI